MSSPQEAEESKMSFSLKIPQWDLKYLRDLLSKSNRPFVVLIIGDPCTGKTVLGDAIKKLFLEHEEARGRGFGITQWFIADGSKTTAADVLSDYYSSSYGHLIIEVLPIVRLSLVDRSRVDFVFAFKDYRGTAGRFFPSLDRDEFRASMDSLPPFGCLVFQSNLEPRLYWFKMSVE